MTTNFGPYGGKQTAVQAEETTLLRFVMECASLSQALNETHTRQTSVHIDMLIKYTDKLTDYQR